MKEKTIYLISTVGFLMIAAGMLIPLIEGPFYTGQCYKYIYSVGAVIMLICSLMSPYKGSDLKLKRLFRTQATSSVLFCAGAFCLFVWPQGTTMRDWIAFTLAGAILRAYATFAIALRTRKLSGNKK